MGTWILTNPFLVLAIGCAALSMVLLLWYLVSRPPLNRATKIVLLFGIGILPIATATMAMLPAIKRPSTPASVARAT